ncbi:MAG: hypothetical protein IH600_05340 [Bacteroidetes bacterium]|nr:hypothetical protein [Bacteroidota bacterium]
MRHSFRSVLIFLISAGCFFLQGCFPNKTAHMAEKDGLEEFLTELRKDATPHNATFFNSSKIFTRDGCIYLFPEGFSVSSDTLMGQGGRYTFGNETGQAGWYAIPRDSIIALTYYEEKHTFGEILGTGLLGAYGGLMSYGAIACLSCPKCCFGSCPTVYVESDSISGIRAECFSYCVSPFVQRPDLDLLLRDADASQPFRMRVTNEALESHFLNRLELLAVSHPADSRIYPTAEGRVVAVRHLAPVRNAHAEEGVDIGELLRAADENAWRSGPDRFADFTDRGKRDAVTFEVPTTLDRDSITLVLRARNTLLTTALFYDVVLGSRGLNALEWTARMAKDESYARFFYALYDQYAGLQVEVERGGRFVLVSSVGDIGPIAWKDFAVRIPASDGITRVRLSFFPDNIALDYIAYARETLDDGAFTVSAVPPTSVEDSWNRSRPELLADIARQDERYVHSTPGDSFLFSYTLPRSAGMTTSVLLRSQGYYYEWLRGNWVRNENVLPPLNIFDVPGILHDLRSRWLSDSRVMEDEFFRNRVPLKERRP